MGKNEGNDLWLNIPDNVTPLIRSKLTPLKWI